MTKVSIIVPVWGVEKYIDKCLDSLVNQTLEDIEIIVVNDESPDNSQKIIDKYVKKYPKKVISLKQKNGGQGSARNNGLKHAKGEYIGYVDSDDYIELDMYEKLYNVAKKKKLDIAICSSYNVYETGNKYVELEKEFFEVGKINAFFGKMAVWNKIYKRNLFINEIEFRSKVWYEDLDFTVKMILNSRKIGYVNEPLYDYLIREGSTMNNNNIQRNLEIIDAFDNILSYMENNVKYKKYYPEIEYLAIYHIFIAAIVRVINANCNNNKKYIINELRNYVVSKFPNYYKNKYLKLLDRNKKIVYNLVRLKQYWLIKLIFSLKERLK